MGHEDWDYRGEPPPQYKNYFKWLKKKLAAGHPVTWMILTKEYAEGSQSGSGAFSHIEPVWGIFSNHSFDDDTVYDDDVVVHGADYWASATVEGPSLYRTFASLPDDERMEGNCANAIPVIGKNEFYPCVMYNVAYGFAISGFVERSGQKSQSLSLTVDRFDEPEYPWDSNNPAADLHGTVSVQGPLQVGSKYTILRWDDFHKVPTDGSYLASQLTTPTILLPRQPLATPSRIQLHFLPRAQHITGASRLRALPWCEVLLFYEQFNSRSHLRKAALNS